MSGAEYIPSENLNVNMEETSEKRGEDKQLNEDVVKGNIHHETEDNDEKVDMDGHASTDLQASGLEENTEPTSVEGREWMHTGDTLTKTNREENGETDRNANVEDNGEAERNVSLGNEDHVKHEDGHDETKEVLIDDTSHSSNKLKEGSTNSLREDANINVGKGVDEVLSEGRADILSGGAALDLNTSAAKSGGEHQSEDHADIVRRDAVPESNTNVVKNVDEAPSEEGNKAVGKEHLEDSQGLSDIHRDGDCHIEKAEEMEVTVSATHEKGNGREESGHNGEILSSGTDKDSELESATNTAASEELSLDKSVNMEGVGSQSVSAVDTNSSFLVTIGLSNTENVEDNKHPTELAKPSRSLEMEDGTGMVQLDVHGKDEDNSIHDNQSIEKTNSGIHQEENAEYFSSGSIISENNLESMEEEADNVNGHDGSNFNTRTTKYEPESSELNIKYTQNPYTVSNGVETEVLIKAIPGEEGLVSNDTQDSETEISQESATYGRDQKPGGYSSDESDAGSAESEIKGVEAKLVSAEPVRQNVTSNHSSSGYSGINLPARPSIPARPAGLGSSAPLLEPPPSRSVQQVRPNGSSTVQSTQVVEEQNGGEADQDSETREKLQAIRVKFLRLANRLGQTPHNVVVAQVLYRLGLAEQLRGSRPSNRNATFTFDRASAVAEQLEASGQEPLDFSCTIMVLGKSGVGKSATINSIFDEAKSATDPFQLGTKAVQEISGTVQGIRVRVIDTPGLLPSSADQRYNEKVLRSVKRFTDKSPPDIVLYFDRLDVQNRDYGDIPLLKTITGIFGPSIWFNAIVVLTHAASAPPDGPNGTPLSYEMFVTQRTHLVQQAIRQAASDLRLMNPVSLVENHSACRTNRAGQRVLPNGQIWKPQLLLLCFASKILAEANALLKLQDTPTRSYASRRGLPLPAVLSSLLQSRQQPALLEGQDGDEDVSDDDLDESLDMDEDDEFDRLPPFRHLSSEELSKLSKKDRKMYFEELKYREKLFVKKQLKLERQRRRWMKKVAEERGNANQNDDDTEEQPSGDVPVPMPDLALPPTFDAENPVHRYRSLDVSNNQWLIRPVYDNHGWDHDVGYDSVNLERSFVFRGKTPVSISGQVTKDKRDAHLQFECAASHKFGETTVTFVGLDAQTVGKDLASTVRAEGRFSNFKNNKTSAGVCATFMGDSIAGGVKLEDKLSIGKCFKMVVNGGAVTGQGDRTCGGSLELTFKGPDYPISRFLTILGVSVMDWHGELAIGGNVTSQVPIGQNTMVNVRANLNNRSSGQLSIKTSSSDHMSLSLVGLIPIFKVLVGGKLFGAFGSSE